MNELSTLVWFALMILGFAGSALFSGMETGVYSLNRIRLHILEHERLPSAMTLRELLARPTTLLSTLLIGNNLSNYLGTAALSVILEKRGYGTWKTVALNLLIVTPVLFVFGETLPKDLFAALADRLMYRLAWVLDVAKRLFTWIGLLPLIDGVSRLMLRVLGSHGPVQPYHPRRLVQTLVKEGVGYGLVSDEQSAIVERVLELGSLHVRDEMVPWHRVVKVGAEDPPGVLWRYADQTSFSRMPVVDGEGRVVGIVSVFDALRHERDLCPPIRQLIRPIVSVRADHTVREVLRMMRENGLAMVIVTERENTKPLGPHPKPTDTTHAPVTPLGIVTIKDLVEPITGELASW